MAEYESLNLPLLCLAESLSDIEAARIAMSHRLGQLSKHDAGLPDIPRLELVLQGLADLEHQAELDLKRAMRKHPLMPWVERSKGVGEKQAARLLAAVGNPYWNHLAQRPRRGPAELWAYTGYHVFNDLPAGQNSADVHLYRASGQTLATPTDHLNTESHIGCVGGVAAKRRKGQKANWNNTAKMRAFLIAESCMKSSGDYRALYEAGRAKYIELPKGHAHNRSLRLVAKEVLKDVFLEAKAWHEA